MTRSPSSCPHSWDRGAASELGARHEQQDRWGLFQSPDQQGLLAILADGMGGHLDGALGAQLVIDEARQFTQNPASPLRDDPLAALDQLCQRMHETINRQSETARSTVVMVWLTTDQAYWLNVGDSRLYHFRDGERLMRTRDHSAVQLLMDLGEIDESEMATHPAQNRLYRCLGGEDRPKPDLGQLAVQTGDLLALCSDGVWEHTTEAEIWDAARANPPNAAARLLTQQAAQRGGSAADNATLILLRADAAAERQTPWLRRLAAGFASLLNLDHR
ncbi:MAG: SpoIIE family protein phosphatase [Candidatus Contendobacter sp.]|nr:SpoIIE family protein phosphatase [Candidatus Contendobacter sp.]